MSDRSFISGDPFSIEWDVAVIGTGMGGATAGYELARLGRRVLFVEKGHFLHEPLLASANRNIGVAEESPNAVPVGDEDAPEHRLRRGLWPERLQGRTNFGDLEFFAPLGCGTGGTTSLFAAALERLDPSDFEPKARFPEVSDSTLPDKWPITFEELRPFYERAEALFRVCGSPDPLGPPSSSSLRPPPPLSSRDQHLFESFSRLGLHPYRAHVACEFVDGCTGCASGPCMRGCKNDAARTCLLPAIEKYGASLLARCEVVRLDASDSEVTSVQCRWRGADATIRARAVVLAAGAYMTPVLLLNSASAEWPAGLANRSGLVGRNLMLHVSDFFAVRPLGRFSEAGPHKSLALNDFYFIEGEKLGTFQTAGARVSIGQIMQYMRDLAERDPAWWRKLASPAPLWWRKLSSPAVRLVAAVMYHVLNFKYAAVWANIVEDLPYHDNRVIADRGAKGGMRIEYRYPAELMKRVQSFRARLSKALGPHRLMVLSGDNNLNFGHVCGTCRFGDDPTTSVLDKNNRSHDLTNLYVVDASFFPSSGGTNPSLTIAANALRVAGYLHDSLSQ